MTAPAVHQTTKRLHAALGGELTKDDPPLDWPLLRFLDGAGHVLGEIDDIVRDSDDGPGWSLILDPDRTRAEWLPWLAMLVGVRLRQEQGTAQRRQAIKDRDGWQRGSPSSILAVANRHIDGEVELVERDESPYHFTVKVPVSALEGETYAALAATHPTYAAFSTAFETYEDVPSNFRRIERDVLRMKPAGLRADIVIDEEE